MKYFLIYVILETIVSINVVSNIGALATLMEMLGSALIGFALLANTRLSLMQNFRTLREGQIASHSLREFSLWSVIIAFLLILPGFLGDVIALMLQIGVFLARLFFPKKPTPTFEEERYVFKERPKGQSDIIDVEVIDDRPALK